MCIYIYIYIYIYMHLYTDVRHEYCIIAVRFRSKSANFTLTLPAEAVPLIPIGGLNGSLDVRPMSGLRNKKDCRRSRSGLHSSIISIIFVLPYQSSLSQAMRLKTSDSSDTNPGSQGASCSHLSALFKTPPVRACARRRKARSSS